METENEELINAGTLPPDSIEPTEELESTTNEIQEPSRFQIFLRKGVIWLGVVVVSFLVGFLVFFLTIYSPLNSKYKENNDSLAQSKQTVDSLQSEALSLNNQISKLEKENQDITSQLGKTINHRELLFVLEEVSTARLALANNDIPGAKIALDKTSSRLEALAPVFASVDANLAQSLSQRLSLVLSGMDKDVETAQVDLQLLSRSLMDIETTLFSE